MEYIEATNTMQVMNGNETFVIKYLLSFVGLLWGGLYWICVNRHKLVWAFNDTGDLAFIYILITVALSIVALCSAINVF